MPYLIRSKGQVLVMRDGVALADPTYEVGPVDWVPFHRLPGGLSEGDNVDCVVKKVDSLEGVKTPESRQARKQRVEDESAAARAKADAEKLAVIAAEAKRRADEAAAKAEQLAKEEAAEKKAQAEAEAKAKAEAEAAAAGTDPAAEHGKRKGKLSDTVKKE